MSYRYYSGTIVVTVLLHCSYPGNGAKCGTIVVTVLLHCSYPGNGAKCGTIVVTVLLHCSYPGNGAKCGTIVVTVLLHCSYPGNGAKCGTIVVTVLLHSSYPGNSAKCFSRWFVHQSSLCLQIGNDTIYPELLLVIRWNKLLECWQLKHKKNSPSKINIYLLFDVQTAYSSTRKERENL